MPCEKALNVLENSVSELNNVVWVWNANLPVHSEWNLNDRLNCIYQMHAPIITEISNSQLNEKAVSELWA